MGFQQQQPGTGSKQNAPQKTAKDQDMNKKKSDQGSCGTGACSTGSKTSAEDEPDADDEMSADRMQNEGDVAGTSVNKKGKIEDDSSKSI